MSLFENSETDWCVGFGWSRGQVEKSMSADTIHHGGGGGGDAVL